MDICWTFHDPNTWTKTMPNIQTMRAELEKKYSKSFVAKMKDDQVNAVYLRLKRQNKI